MPIDMIEFESKEIVYTDTKLSHRFLRFSVPTNGNESDSFDGQTTCFPIKGIVTLLN